MSSRRRSAGGATARYRSWARRLRRLADIVLQATRDLFNDGAPQWAAAIAYYSLLSTFPLLLATASIASFFVEPKWAVEQATQLLGPFLPQGETQIEQIVKEALDARQSVGLLSLAALLWTGTRVFGSITMALNIAYDVGETYGFLHRLLIEATMLVTVGLFFVLALVARPLVGLAWQALQFLPAEGLVFQAARVALPVVLLVLAFFLIYRFAPRRRPEWLAALSGALVAALLFMLARPLFLGYVQRFGEYNLIYGSITIIVILVLWAWIVALILLYGGEISSHVQAMAIEGQSAQEVDQRHKARSPVRKGESEAHEAYRHAERRLEAEGGQGRSPSPLRKLATVASTVGAVIFERLRRG